MKIGIYYGSTTGNTQGIAARIRDEFSDNEVVLQSVANAEVQDLLGYDLLILGSSTWGLGELQDDWESFLPKFEGINFNDKKVALFGVGDQNSWGDSFVDALGILYEQLVGCGADIIGACSIAGYEFNESKAVLGEQFVGMVFDEDNQSELTDERISAWAASLKKLI